MKNLLKYLLYAVAPRWTTTVMSARARSHSQKVIASWGNSSLSRKLSERFGNQVQEGPFAGLILTVDAQAEQFGPYLLGVYESELDDAWEQVFYGDYTQIVDIGAKFGYYAVGLAKKYPRASVIAFDTDWWARDAIRKMASANAAYNIEIRGFCEPIWLKQAYPEPRLIIVDCEGYEAVLFSGAIDRCLQKSTLIIETHDTLVPGISNRLITLFQESHFVKVYDEKTVRRETNLSLDGFTEHERQLATQEVRPPQLWLLCLPKTGTNCTT